ncbi:MAG: hypothetical protein ACT4P7_22215, partial [Gemmatimonadaceae bacterium]
MTTIRISACVRRWVARSALLVAAACSGVLDVENQRDSSSDDRNAPEAVPALMAGVAGDVSAGYMLGARVTGY